VWESQVPVLLRRAGRVAGGVTILAAHSNRVACDLVVLVTTLPSYSNRVACDLVVLVTTGKLAITATAASAVAPAIAR